MEPYERLLGDAMAGDATEFARQDYVEEAWRIVDPVLKADTPVYVYDPGTWGPAEAAKIAPPDGGWQNPRMPTRRHQQWLMGEVRKAVDVELPTGGAMQIEILPNADAVAKRAAAIVAADARQAVAARG